MWKWTMASTSNPPNFEVRPKNDEKLKELSKKVFENVSDYLQAELTGLFSRRKGNNAVNDSRL